MYRYFMMSTFFAMTATLTANDGIVTNYNYWVQRHSSTAAEGYMRGQGHRAAGYGRYLRALGEYQNANQDAVRKHYENEDFRIKQYWDTKRAWEAEQKRRREEKFGIKAEHKRLDKVIERADLESRKKDLRDLGLLPPKRPQSFVYKGKDYGTYAEFKKSGEYQKMLAAAKRKRYINSFRERIAEKKGEKALKFLSERSVMTPGEKLMADERSRSIRRLRIRLGDDWVDKWLD